jgi:septal ring factor EnvC (AmiA/AmiB activator)
VRRTYLVFALTLAFCPPLYAQQTIGDQIRDLQKQLGNGFAKRTEFQSQTKILAQKKDDILFAFDAWKKQSGIFEQDANDLNMRMDALDAKVEQHNAHQCTEQCVNGHCDGSCAGYTAEKQKLDDQQGALRAEQAQLGKTANLLDQIRAQGNTDTEAWATKAKQLIADNADNEANIEHFQAQLVDLRKQYDSCRGSIPADCQVRNVLNDKCERMHAACGKLFDGN